MNVREGNPGDVDALVAFDQVAATDAARVAMLEQAAAEGRLLVADGEAEPFGFLVSSDRLLGHPFIELVYVKQSARRRGIAAALTRAAIDRCAGGTLWTSTNESNTPAQRLFESLGFVQCGRIEGLDEGDPELIYRRTVATEG